MKFLNATFLYHVYQYVCENLRCLLYVVEVLPDQTVYFTAYFSLVKDIAEAYGSGVAFIILLVSAVLSMMATQQLLAYGNTRYSLGVRSGQVDTPLSRSRNSTNGLSRDSYFTNFKLFRLFKGK
jgi:hypothetical protein